MGWFDGNPARLWPHPPEELASRYVDAIGGIDRVVELAQQAYDAGDFRWAATLLDHAVFADESTPVPAPCYAATLEQLAYGAENGTWRNFFLSGATELRDGNFGTAGQATSPSFSPSSRRSRSSTPWPSASTGRGLGPGPRLRRHAQPISTRTTG